MSKTFNGFERSNTTPIPDVLFDELLTELSGAELKVLLYIMRRTWGFKKDTDAISMSQFQHGIVTREGKRLDSGCGIKRRETICQTLARLEADGYIESRKAKESVGDNAVTVYCIRFKEVVSKPDHPQAQGSFKTGLPVVSKPDQGSPLTGPRVVSKPDPQYTGKQETALQETVRQDNDSPRGRTSANVASSSGYKKSDLLSLASPGVQSLVAEWKVCHTAFYQGKKPFRVNKTLIDHAETLITQYGLLPGDLTGIVQRMRDNDKKGWYAEHGLHLGCVVNEVEKNPPRRSPITGPQQQEPQPVATSTDFEAIAKEMKGLVFERGQECIMLRYGYQDFEFVEIYNRSDWEATEGWTRNEAAKYAESIKRQVTQPIMGKQAVG